MFKTEQPPKCKDCGRELTQCLNDKGALGCLYCLQDELEDYTAEELRDALTEVRARQRKEIN